MKLRRKPYVRSKGVVGAGKASTSAYLRNYGRYLAQLIDDLDHKAIEMVIKCLLDARGRGSTIFFAGNGGSAATASHFSQDLGEVGRKTGCKAFRTISLNDSVPYMTALGNDYGYEHIFAGQLENHFRKGDVLVAISASGNSPNMVEAVKLANKMRGTTIGLVGFDGGKMSGLCTHIVITPTPKGEYGPVEDIHLVLNHMITTCIMEGDLAKGAKGRSVK